MAVETELLDDLVIARLRGDIDHHGAKMLREQIDSAVIAGNVRELELDFREVCFMDSSGIGLVMGRYKLMQEMGGALHLVNVAAHLKKVMVLAGLDRLAILDKPDRRQPNLRDDPGRASEETTHFVERDGHSDEIDERDEAAV